MDAGSVVKRVEMSLFLLLLSKSIRSERRMSLFLSRNISTLYHTKAA